MYERELHTASGEHSLERLLDRLLGMEANDRIRHGVKRDHRLNRCQIVGGAAQQLVRQVPRSGHQAASSRPSVIAAPIRLLVPEPANEFAN